MFLKSRLDLGREGEPQRGHVTSPGALWEKSREHKTPDWEGGLAESTTPDSVLVLPWCHSEGDLYLRCSISFSIPCWTEEGGSSISLKFSAFIHPLMYSSFIPQTFLPSEPIVRVKLLWPKEKCESCHPVLAGADPKTLLQPVCVHVRASVCVCVWYGHRLTMFFSFMKIMS